MEMYFVTQITKEKGSNAYATLVTPKDTLDGAKALFHQICASVYANENIEHAIIEVQDFYANNVLRPETIIPEIVG